jgi:hypothetical protein
MPIVFPNQLGTALILEESGKSRYVVKKWQAAMSSVCDQRKIHDRSGAVSGGCVGDHCVGGRTSNILGPGH